MEKIDHKWETKQAAKMLFIISLLFTCALAQAQTLIPTNNKGGYTFEEILFTDEKANTNKIYGRALSLKDKSEIGEAKITFGCTTISTNANGEFEFTVKNNDLKINYLKIVALGYKTVETEFFNINPDLKLEIIFFLEEDDKPFINCAEK